MIPKGGILVQAQATLPGTGLPLFVPFSGYFSQGPFIDCTNAFGTAQSAFQSPDSFALHPTQTTLSALNPHPMIGFWRSVAHSAEYSMSFIESTCAAAPTISELVEYAQQSLEQWKKDPDTYFDYACFVLDAEAADDPGLNREELEKWWQETMDYCEGIIGPRDLFEALTSARQTRKGFTYPTRSEGIPQLMRSITKNYFLRHADDVSKMSEICKRNPVNCSVRMKFTICVLNALQNCLSDNQVLGIQYYSDHAEPVIYDKETEVLWDLTSGRRTKDILLNVYHPAYLFYSFLRSQGKKSPVAREELILLEGSLIDDHYPSEIPGYDLFEGAPAPIALGESFSFLDIVMPPKVGPIEERIYSLRHEKGSLGWIALELGATMVSCGFAGLALLLFTAIIYDSIHKMPFFGEDFDAVAKDECQKEMDRARRGDAELEMKRLGFAFLNPQDRKGPSFLGYRPFEKDGVTEFVVCPATDQDTEKYQQLNLEGKYAFLLERMQRYENSAEFKDALKFLTRPQTAILDMDPHRLEHALELIKWLEFQHEDMNKQIEYAAIHPSNYSNVKADLSARSEKWQQFYNNLGNLQRWMHDNPLDFIVYVNAAPLAAKMPLLELMPYEVFDYVYAKMFTNVSMTTDEKEITPYSPSGGPNFSTGDIIPIEVMKVLDTGFNKSSPKQDEPLQPEKSLEQEPSRVKISADTAISLLREMNNRYRNIIRGNNFKLLVESEFWDADMSQQFLEKYSDDPSLLHVMLRIGEVTDFAFPEHMKPLLKALCHNPDVPGYLKQGPLCHR